MFCPGDNGFSLNLEPNFETDRTDLRIHPDGNAPGTAGCIGVGCDAARELENRLGDYFENNKSIPVEVYGDY